MREIFLIGELTTGTVIVDGYETSVEVIKEWARRDSKLEAMEYIQEFFNDKENEYSSKLLTIIPVYEWT